MDRSKGGMSGKDVPSALVLLGGFQTLVIGVGRANAFGFFVGLGGGDVPLLRAFWVRILGTRFSNNSKPVVWPIEKSLSVSLA